MDSWYRQVCLGIRGAWAHLQGMAQLTAKIGQLQSELQVSRESADALREIIHSGSAERLALSLRLRDSRKQNRRLRLSLAKAQSQIAIFHEERMYLGKINALNHRRLDAAIKSVALTDEVEDVQQPTGLPESMPFPFSELDRR